jgi:hypothetical protein
MENRILSLFIAITILIAGCSSQKKMSQKNGTPKYKTLIVNGQNNHNWKIGSATLKEMFVDSELFTVEVATSPEKGAGMSNFKPDFSAYDLIVLDYNGDEWCEETKDSFVAYVKKGGGCL